MLKQHSYQYLLTVQLINCIIFLQTGSWLTWCCILNSRLFFYVIDLSLQLPFKTIPGMSLPFQGIHIIHACNGCPICVFSVRYTYTLQCQIHVLLLHVLPLSWWLGNTLDVITKNFEMTLAPPFPIFFLEIIDFLEILFKVNVFEPYCF